MDKRPIGVYDSGIGGLTVLSVLRRALPHEDFIYFADTANLPYGDKSPQQIIDYSHRIVKWFEKNVGAKLVVSACHTSSALAVEKISSDFKTPVIGTIKPLLKRILHNPFCSNIGVIATMASAASRAHEKIFIENGFKGRVVSIACPDFVPLIEAGLKDSVLLREAAVNYLQPFKQNRLDTLVYGCTHYPLISDVITSIVPEVCCIDPAEYVVQEIKALLAGNGLLNGSSGGVQFYVSSEPGVFINKLQRLSMEGATATLVDLV
jgi:glutamate racemase